MTKPTRILTLALAAAAALHLAGCGEKCPTEAPEGTAQACTAAAGQPVTVRVQPCQKCNQSGTTCEVDVQGNEIQLDLTSEACEDASSCPPACELASAVTCSFPAPAASANPYVIRLYDPSTNKFPVVATLTVTAGAAPSCTLQP